MRRLAGQISHRHSPPRRPGSNASAVLETTNESVLSTNASSRDEVRQIVGRRPSQQQSLKFDRRSLRRGGITGVYQVMLGRITLVAYRVYVYPRDSAQTGVPLHYAISRNVEASKLEVASTTPLPPGKELGSLPL